MAITVKWYGNGLLACMKNNVDLEVQPLKLTLHTSTYVPDQDLHVFRSDLTNEVVNGGGYTTGGIALTTPVLSYDAATDQVRFDIADPSWTFTATKTWRVGVVQVVRGGAATADELIAYLLWDADQSVSTTYTLTIDPAGLLFIDAT